MPIEHPESSRLMTRRQDLKLTSLMPTLVFTWLCCTHTSGHRFARRSTSEYSIYPRTQNIVADHTRYFIFSGLGHFGKT